MAVKRKKPLRELKGRKRKQAVKARRKKKGKSPSVKRLARKPSASSLASPAVLKKFKGKPAIIVRLPGGRTRRLAATAAMVSLAFVLSCKTAPKPVKPAKPPKPPVVKKEPLPALVDFDAFLKAFQEKLKTRSPEEIARQYPEGQRKAVLEALTLLAKAKAPQTFIERSEEKSAVAEKVRRFIEEQTRMDRVTMRLLADQWIEDLSMRSTAELLKRRLELRKRESFRDEYEFDVDAVTRQILHQILLHRLRVAGKK
jgi:hypothetical protein